MTIPRPPKAAQRELPDGATPARTHYMRVVDRLRADVLGDVFKPGHWLKTVELEQRYRVSAQPVREALQALAGEGLVVLTPNRGARVRELDLSRIAQVYEVREAIEATITRRFAEQASTDDIERLCAAQTHHDAAVSAGRFEAADVANLRFHDVIMRWSGNAEAISTRDRYMALSKGLRNRFGYRSDRWAEARDHHHAILAAIKNRDGVEAYLRASAHVRATLVELLDRIATGETR